MVCSVPSWISAIMGIAYLLHIHHNIGMLPANELWGICCELWFVLMCHCGVVWMQVTGHLVCSASCGSSGMLDLRGGCAACQHRPHVTSRLGASIASNVITWCTLFLCEFLVGGASPMIDLFIEFYFNSLRVTWHKNDFWGTLECVIYTCSETAGVWQWSTMVWCWW